MHRRLDCCRLLIALVAACWMLPLAAQPVGPSAAIDDPAIEGSAVEAADPGSDSGALRPYVAGIADAVRRREHIPGIVIAIVRGDQVLLAEGHGLANVEPPRRADADNTLFRIASISKTFTYTATMQLVERGLIALDDPVNQHLPESLQVAADGYAEPVRVRHLLSHTAGFEDRVLGHLFERDPAEVRSLHDYLVQERPRRVRAPDTAAVYSNYSVALLGALVAQRSGLAFEDYIEHNLTGPLGMTHTTFREPLHTGDPRHLDASLAADIASGYRYSGDAWVAGDFEHIAHGAPAGGVSTTARDMARWMRVHLNDGELDGVRILSADTAQRMRTLLFRNAAEVPGVAHGFLTETYGPYFAYGHGGAILHFHSTMVLIPELDLGVFVSANAAHARASVRDLARLVVEHLAPDARPQPQPIAVSAQELQRYAGVYRGNRRPYRSVEKLLLGLDAEAVVTADAEASLRVHADGRTQRLLPIGPHLFQEADGNNRVQFLVGSGGEVSSYVYGHGILIMERVGALQRARSLYLLLAAVALICIVRLWRSRQRPRAARANPALFAVKALSRVNAVVWLAFLALAVITAITMGRDGSAVVFTYPSRWLLLAMLAATVAAVLTLLEVLALLPVWRGQWGLGARLRYTLGVGVLALTVVVLWTWNVIGWRT